MAKKIVKPTPAIVPAQPKKFVVKANGKKVNKEAAQSVAKKTISKPAAAVKQNVK